MEATLRLPRAATYADYLAVEGRSEHRHEFIDGVIVAMAGGSDEHNALAARLAMLLGMRLPRGCRYYSPDQRFWIAARGRGRYSDGSIICGKPEHPAHDAQATSNPLVVLEVLSPSSQGDDEGDKRRDFQTLESLHAYLLVHQDSRAVRVYIRGEEGWSEASQLHVDGDSIFLPRLTEPLPVAAIYDDILDERGRSLLK